MLGTLAEQILSKAVNGPRITDCLGRPKGGPQEPDAVEILQPLTISDIAFAAGDIFNMPGVDQAHLNASLRQMLMEWHPVNTGRFHGHGSDPAFQQPLDDG